MRNHEPSAIKRARSLRRDQSPPEAILWKELRNGGLGVKIRRQVAMGPYVLDFYCAAASLNIEVDGHGHDDRLDRDEVRDAYLLSEGIRTLRITASDVSSRKEWVIQLIWDECHKDDQELPLLAKQGEVGDQREPGEGQSA